MFWDAKENDGESCHASDGQIHVETYTICEYDSDDGTVGDIKPMLTVTYTIAIYYMKSKRY